MSAHIELVFHILLQMKVSSLLIRVSHVYAQMRPTLTSPS